MIRRRALIAAEVVARPTAGAAVVVTAREVRKDAVAATCERPGTRMVHCHVLDHEVAGMMTSIAVK